MIKIVQCGKCKAKNRIKPYSARFRPICGSCGSPLPYNRPSSVFVLILSKSILPATLVGVVCGIVFTPALLQKDFLKLMNAEKRKTEEQRKGEEKKLSDLESRLKVELTQINPSKLREEAAAHYSSIFDSRRSYDSRYALTPREKAQLRMRELATDSTKSYHEAIKAVALEASPRGSDIEVKELFGETTLSIDFDMSSLTSGEHGTRTKHHTKTTLKKEVETLISRVTNDLFQSCKDLDLQTISVGCRHYVITKHLDGSTQDQNIVLFKIRIQKKYVSDFWNNPFLDVYSTTQYLEVEEDNFGTIEIVTTRI